MKKYLLILLTIPLAISACTATETATEVPASLNGAWELIAFGPADATTPAVPDTEAGLTFNEDGTVTGNSGCNGLGGTYTVEGDQVTFSEIISTLMACDDPRMAQEDAVQQVLAGTATFEIEGNTLTLTNGDMALILTK